MERGRKRECAGVGVCVSVCAFIFVCVCVCVCVSHGRFLTEVARGTRGCSACTAQYNLRVLYRLKKENRLLPKGSIYTTIAELIRLPKTMIRMVCITQPKAVNPSHHLQRESSVSAVAKPRVVRCRGHAEGRWRIKCLWFMAYGLWFMVLIMT